MEKPVRPASDAYPSVCCSLKESGSHSSEAGLVSDEGDQAPIFSMSKSSMDMKAGGPSHKQDPVWTRLDLRRSSSTGVHSEQNAVALKQHSKVCNLWQHTNNQQFPWTTQSTDVHITPVLSERWVPSMQRWSGCSGGTQSRSSTPDTIVWRGVSSRPTSLTQDVSSTPSSPMYKRTSPSVTASSLISPLDAISLPQEDLFSPITPSLTPDSAIDQQEHIQELTSPNSTLRSPQPTPELQSNAPDHLNLKSSEDDGLLENSVLTFQFPSPIPSSDHLTDAETSLDPKCLVDDVIEKLSSPQVIQLLDDGVKNSAKLFASVMPNFPEEKEEERRQPLDSHLELPWLSEMSCSKGRGKKSPLVSSLSDSGLSHCCKCKQSAREVIWRGDAFREEVMMTPQKEMVDMAAQTASPLGSWWDLRRNMSNSNIDSHSILGSPPGSRLNLKSSVGSNSNLVSLSSSMFPVSSGDEQEEDVGRAKRGDDPAWDIVSTSSHDLERRRSCLKIQAEEKDSLGRRSSMKQVQWDEDGMTWDVHGASVDPEVLSTVIRKHLEVHNSPKVPRQSSKKKRAPNPPNISNTIAAPQVMSDPTDSDSKMEEAQKGETKQGEAAELPRRSQAEVDKVKDEEEEVYGGGILVTKRQSHVSGHGQKRSVIRSLWRPGWCGASKKTHD